MPTIDTTPLDDDPAPALTLAGTGTEYVVLIIDGTFDVVDSVFVLPVFDGTPTVSIEVDTAYPTGLNVSTTGTFTFPLAKFVDGVKDSQYITGPLTGDLCDTLTQEAKAQLHLLIGL